MGRSVHEMQVELTVDASRVSLDSECGELADWLAIRCIWLVGSWDS